MRKLLVILSLVLTALFITATAFSLWYFAQGNAGISEEKPSVGKSARFRVVAILPNNNDKVVNLLRTTFVSTFNEANIAIEILLVDNQSLPTKESLLIERAILTKPQAIILYPQHNEELEPIINYGVGRNINIITVISDVPGSKRNAFIGNNPFELGQKTAELVLKIRPNGSRIGVILPSGNGHADTSNSLFMSAIYRRFYSMPEFKVVSIKYSELGTPQGEEVSSEMLAEFPAIDFIISTNPDDTVGVAQTLIESNKIKLVSVIGFDKSTEVDELKQRGVISGIISRNPEKIASLCLNVIVDLQESFGSSSYVDPGIEAQE